MAVSTDAGRARSRPARAPPSPARSGSGCARRPACATSKLVLLLARARLWRPRPSRWSSWGPSASSSRRVYWLGLVIVIPVIVLHVVLRVVAPQADPFVFPIARAAERHRHRRDLPHRHRHATSAAGTAFGVRQIVWTAIAIVVAIVVLLVVRNHRVLQRYRYIAMFSRRSSCCCCPMLPVIGRTVSGARVWISIGPFSFQPGELAKIALADLLRRLPGHRPRLAVDGRAHVPRHAVPARARPRARSW